VLCLDKEVPHATAVEVTRFTERESGIIDLDVTIYCEKPPQGHHHREGGAMLKKIGALARTDIETFKGTKVFLQTWVKVKENWRDSQPSSGTSAIRSSHVSHHKGPGPRESGTRRPARC
jgi:GTP-binding protein Era